MIVNCALLGRETGGGVAGSVLVDGLAIYLTLYYDLGEFEEDPQVKVFWRKTGCITRPVEVRVASAISCGGYFREKVMVP